MRIIRSLAKLGLIEILALAMAVAYVLLDNALPSRGGELLAAAILLFIAAAIVWRFIQVIRDPVAAVRDKDR